MGRSQEKAGPAAVPVRRVVIHLIIPHRKKRETFVSRFSFVGGIGFEPMAFAV